MQAHKEVRPPLYHFPGLRPQWWVLLHDISKYWEQAPSLIWERFCICYRPGADMKCITTNLPWTRGSVVVETEAPFRFSERVFIPALWALFIHEALCVGGNNLQIVPHKVGDMKQHTCPLGTIFCTALFHEPTCLAVVARRDNQTLITSSNIMLGRAWEWDQLAHTFWFEHGQR